MKLTLWGNRSEAATDRIIATMSRFTVTPAVYADLERGEDAYRLAIRTRVPQGWKGMILGNVSETMTGSSRRGESDWILHWLRAWGIQQQERPGTFMPIYGLGQPPLRPKATSNTLAAVKTWDPLWYYAGGYLPTGYDAHDNATTGRWAQDDIAARAAAMVEWRDELCPTLPLIVSICLHYTHNTPAQWTLIDREQMWNEQVAPFIGVPNCVLALWGLYSLNYYRRTAFDRFKDHCEPELDAVGVDVFDAEACRRYYRRRAIEECAWISYRASQMGVID